MVYLGRNSLRTPKGCRIAIHFRRLVPAHRRHQPPREARKGLRHGWMSLQSALTDALSALSYRRAFTAAHHGGIQQQACRTEVWRENSGQRIHHTNTSHGSTQLPSFRTYRSTRQRPAVMLVRTRRSLRSFLSPYRTAIHKQSSCRSGQICADQRATRFEHLKWRAAHSCCLCRRK